MDCTFAKRLSFSMLGKFNFSHAWGTIYGRRRNMWCCSFNKISSKLIKWVSSYQVNQIFQLLPFLLVRNGNGSCVLKKTNNFIIISITL